MKYTLISLAVLMPLMLVAGTVEIDQTLLQHLATLNTQQGKVDYLASVLSGTNEPEGASPNSTNHSAFFEHQANLNKASAIRLLAVVADSNACPILVNYLTFHDRRDNRQTACDVLARMGEPAIPALLEVFSHSDDRFSLAAAAQTIGDIKGAGYLPFVEGLKGKMSDAAWQKLSRMHPFIGKF